MKITRILSLAAAVLTLAACGNEEFIENNPGNVHDLYGQRTADTHTAGRT